MIYLSGREVSLRFLREHYFATSDGQERDLRKIGKCQIQVALQEILANTLMISTLISSLRKVGRESIKIDQIEMICLKKCGDGLTSIGLSKADGVGQPLNGQATPSVFRR
jgi:hypothetical protein